MSLGVSLLLHSFNRTVVFGFILDSWEVFSHILSHPSGVEYRFHLVDWALSQIRYRLVTPQNFVCHVTQTCSQSSIGTRPIRSAYVLVMFPDWPSGLLIFSPSLTSSAVLPLGPRRPAWPFTCLRAIPIWLLAAE